MKKGLYLVLIATTLATSVSYANDRFNNALLVQTAVIPDLKLEGQITDIENPHARDTQCAFVKNANDPITAKDSFYIAPGKRFEITKDNTKWKLTRIGGLIEIIREEKTAGPEHPSEFKYTPPVTEHISFMPLRCNPPEIDSASASKSSVENKTKKSLPPADRTEEFEEFRLKFYEFGSLMEMESLKPDYRSFTTINRLFSTTRAKKDNNEQLVTQTPTDR